MKEKMKMKYGIKTNPFVLDPGTYRIGDPCYSIPQDRWMEWLVAADYENQNHLGAELDGYQIVALHTPGGDGVYPDQHGRRYGVDAGLVGAVPVDLLGIVDWGGDLKAAQQGIYHVHTFTERTQVWADDDGALNFGTLMIFTGDETEEEEE